MELDFCKYFPLFIPLFIYSVGLCVSVCVCVQKFSSGKKKLHKDSKASIKEERWFFLMFFILRLKLQNIKEFNHI